MDKARISHSHIGIFISFQRIVAHLHTARTPPYVINLDPAVHEVPFPANIGQYNNCYALSGLNQELPDREKFSSFQ